MVEIERAWRKDVRNRLQEFKSEMGREGKILRWLALCDQAMTLSGELQDADARYSRVSLRMKYIAGKNIIELKERFDRCLKAMSIIENSFTGTSDKSITPDDIERAREYPLTNLVEHRGYMARCPFHGEDKHPSMTIKGNRYTCFTCGESGDSIAMVMKLDGIGFIEAVKYLGNKA